MESSIRLFFRGSLGWPPLKHLLNTAGPGKSSECLLWLRRAWCGANWGGMAGGSCKCFKVKKWWNSEPKGVMNINNIHPLPSYGFFKLTSYTSYMYMYNLLLCLKENYLFTFGPFRIPRSASRAVRWPSACGLQKHRRLVTGGELVLECWAGVYPGKRTKTYQVPQKDSKKNISKGNCIF